MLSFIVNWWRGFILFEAFRGKNLKAVLHCAIRLRITVLLSLEEVVVGWPFEDAGVGVRVLPNVYY